MGLNPLAIIHNALEVISFLLTGVNTALTRILKKKKNKQTKQNKTKQNKTKNPFCIIRLRSVISDFVKQWEDSSLD